MKFCPRCGTPRELNFCRNCGFAYEAVAPEAPQEVAPQETAPPAFVDVPVVPPVVEEVTATSPTRIDVAYGDGFNPEAHCTNCGEPKAVGFDICLLCGQAR